MNAGISKDELRRRRRRVAEEHRQRVSKACSRCKGRKNKCVETSTGVCRRCQEGSHFCTFARERSLPVTGPGIVTFPAPEVGNGVGSQMQSMQNEPQANLDVQTPRVRQQNAAGVDHTLPSSDALAMNGFLSRRRDAFCLPIESVPSESLRRAEAAQSTPSRSATPSSDEYRRLQNAFARFPPQAIAQFLVEVCVEHGTDSFFYFDQARFAIELDDLYDNVDSRLRSDPSFKRLALAVFALGSQWTTLAKPTDQAATSLSVDDDPGRIFYDQAELIIGSLIATASTRSVQAAFVLSVYLMPANATGAAYVCMGLAKRKAMSIDLHRQDVASTTSEVDRELRRRLWWAIYSLERCIHGCIP